ncbi:mutator type transposase [Tanacetum coccineum]
MCLGALKQGFKACGGEILGLDGCFMAGPWPDQILTAVEVDANNGIYPVAYAIVEAQSHTPKSLTLEIHHAGWFTPTPSRSYIGGHVSSVNVVDIDEFCLHDLKDMVVKLIYDVEDLMYCHFLIPSLGLDYGLYNLNVDADVLEMAKYVNDYKIILVYVEHESSNVDTSIFVTPKKEVAIAVDNHLRKAPIEIDSILDVNRNLTPMCHKILKKEWEQVSSKSLSIGEVINNLTKKQPSSSVEAPIVVECAEDLFEELDDILGEYAHIGKQITGNEITGNEITRNESTGNEITGKHMVVHVGNSFTVDDVLELEMPFETEGVGPVGKFKEVEVDAGNESEEESDTEGDYKIDSDSEDLDYDPKHDDVFDDDEHIVEEVHANMNNFIFTADPKHDTSIGGVDVQDDDLDVIDYDAFGSDLDDGIDSERRMQLRELRRIGKQKNKGPNKYYLYLGQQFASKEIVKGRVKKHSVETRRQLILVKNDNERVRVRCQGTIPALVPYVAIDNNMDKNVFSVNPCNGRDMWPVVESRTVIILPLYKPPIGRPPKKRKKSNDEIASQSASSGKLSRKGKLVSCGKCGNVGHNRKGCRGQGGGSSQAGARKVSGQAAGATNVSGQAVGARKVSGQDAGETNVSGQAAGARKVSG